MTIPNQHNGAAPNHSLASIGEIAYPAAVLNLYLGLPHTPDRASPHDKAVARALFEQAVPLELVEAALLMASLRRLIRPPGALPLPRIRSLAYFCPVIAELQQRPLPAGYLDYLRHKARQLFTLAEPSRQRALP